MLRPAAVLAALLTLAACSSSAPPSPAGPAVTAAPAATAVTAASTLTRLQHAGLPVKQAAVYRAADDPNHLLGRPGGYTSKVAFVDTRLTDPGGQPGDVVNGGGIEVFASTGDATARDKYVSGIAKSVAFLSEYDYQSGRVLLRLSHLLTPTQAAAYQHALG